MTGNDNEGSQSVYGSDVEIVTSGSATPSATASNKVKFSFSIIYQDVPYLLKVFLLYFPL